ncbi:solute carrier family 4 member 11-like isoform X2 [Ptychodera flava]|uniref:solute carrier family 4 member 11-like isoform X2 n=1 Tax=Ptychodera flava TaxID=63121 RepID=UPI00396AA79E
MSQVSGINLIENTPPESKTVEVQTDNDDIEPLNPSKSEPKTTSHAETNGLAPSSVDNDTAQTAEGDDAHLKTGNGYVNEAMVIEPEETASPNEAGASELQNGTAAGTSEAADMNSLHVKVDEKTGKPESFTVDCGTDHLLQASRSPTMRTTRQILQTLDYTKEVQAKQELLSFVKEVTVMLDLTEDGALEELLDPLLKELIAHEHAVSLEQARRAIFTDGCPYFPSSSVQSFNSFEDSGRQYVFDESWLALGAGIQSLRHRRVGVARLKTPVNMGLHRTSVRYIFLVIAPNAERGLKSARATAHLSGSLFANAEFRNELHDIADVGTFKQALIKRAQVVTSEILDKGDASHHHVPGLDDVKFCRLGSGIYKDLKRRLPYYWSDYKDGITAENGLVGGCETLRRLASAVLFLYFTCFFYTLALGDLYYIDTHGYMGVKEAIVGGAIVGVAYSLFGGQPMSIILTTAPLALYTKVIYKVSKKHHVDFLEMYFAVGCWTTFFLILYALFNASRLMKWATRSIDEILGLFVAMSLLKESVMDIHEEFDRHYRCSTHDGAHTEAPHHQNATIEPPHVTTGENTINSSLSLTTVGHELMTVLGGATEDHGGGSSHDVVDGHTVVTECSPEISVLFIMLVLMTTWLGIVLYRLKDSPFLPPTLRYLLSDQALGITVIFFSFVGSYCFRAITVPQWQYREGVLFRLPTFGSMDYKLWLGASGMAFPLSLLLFLENNLTSLTVNAPANKVKKGTAYHWDLLFLAILNFFMSMFGFPMVHAAVPHSPMHVRILADTEERIDFGYLHTMIVKVRETRLSSLIASIAVAVSLLMLPMPLKYIPKPVLTGVWVYLALQTFIGNHFFQRLTLLFTEKSAYPTDHHVRRVPERTMHLFTFIQILQLVLLCAFGLATNIYMKMAFPLILLLYIPFRQLVLPIFIKREYLLWIDCH